MGINVVLLPCHVDSLLMYVLMYYTGLDMWSCYNPIFCVYWRLTHFVVLASLEFIEIHLLGFLSAWF